MSATDCSASFMKSHWISFPSVLQYRLTKSRSCSVAFSYQPNGGIVVMSPGIDYTIFFITDAEENYLAGRLKMQTEGLSFLENQMFPEVPRLLASQHQDLLQ